MKRRAAHAPRSTWPLIVGFLVLAALVVGLAYAAWRTQARAMQTSAERSVQAVSDLKAAGIAAWLQERRADAEVIATNGLFSAAVQDLLEGRDNGTASARLRSYLGQAQRTYRYVDVLLVDPGGEILLRVPASARHSLGVRVQELVDEAQRTGTVVTSDLYIAADGAPRLETVGPVPGARPGDPPIAAVVLHSDPAEFLFPYIQEWPLAGSSGETLLVERRGDRVLYLNELRHRQGAALALSIPLTRTDLPAAMAVQGTTGVVHGLDYRGVPVFAAIEPVPGTDWFVISKVDNDEVLGAIRLRGWLTAGFTLLVVGLAAAGTVLLWRARESQAAAELRESEERYRALVEHAPVAVFVNRDDRLVLVNAACVRLFGASSAEDLLGRSPFELFHRDFHAGMRERIQVLEDEARPVPTIEERIVRLDGGVVDVEVTAAPFHDRGENAIHVVLADITARRRAERDLAELNDALEERVQQRTAQLDAANKELEAFAYSVSHDLRAPLRHLSGFSELLAGRAGDALDEKSRHYLDTILRASRDMGALIDDLLQFSRTGRVEVQLEDVDMDEVLRQALEPLRHETASRSIDWRIAPLPHVTGDRALLRQVWANLLGNAAKYSRGRAPAIIEVGVLDGQEPARQAEVFFVRDNGVGFDMQYAHKLFGVFQRLHSSGEFEGTGIGLANVHRIVTRLGGRVWAEGATGEGATFFFSLPRRRGTHA